MRMRSHLINNGCDCAIVINNKKLILFRLKIDSEMVASLTGINATHSTAVGMAASYHDVPIMALSVTWTQIVFRLSVVAVGVLLNGVVFLAVSCSPQLRYPRHIFWAAVALVDWLFLAQCVLELAAIVHRSHLACMLNVILAFTDYSILLLFLFLAAVDRYVALVRYATYQRCVTNSATVKLLGGASMVTFAIVTSPLWTGQHSVHACTINLAQMHWVSAWNSLLAICCVVLHVVIFIQSRTAIRTYFPNHRQTPMTLKFVHPAMPSADHPSGIGAGEKEAARVARVSAPVRLENGPFLNRSLAQELGFHGDDPHVSPAKQQMDNECFPWAQDRSVINRLEARAAVRMSVHLLPIWLCTLPISVVSIAIYWCVRLDGDCRLLGQIMSYLRDLFLLHSVYNPVMYMCTSTEFRRAFRHMAWKLGNGCRLRAN